MLNLQPKGDFIFLARSGGKKWRGNHFAKPSVGRLGLGVVQHLLLYFPMELAYLPERFLAPCEID